MPKIIPTILEKEFSEIRRKVSLFLGTAELIQIDFVDGKFAPNTTFMDFERLGEIDTKELFELDLLVVDPSQFLKNQIKNVASMVFHVESGDPKNLMDCLIKSRKIGYKTGISLNPKTPTDVLEELLEFADFVQFHTGEPGFQGKPFVKEVVQKIRQFVEKHPDVRVQVDGGIGEDSIGALQSLNLHAYVIGSEIFTAPDPYARFISLKEKYFKSQNKLMKIAFLGGAGWQEHEKVYKDALETAKILAMEGYEIINGGGPGVMRAATQGAHLGGGKVLAVTYHPNKIKRNFEGVDPKNTFDEEVITLDYFDRTKVLLQNSDVHVVFNGATGTVSEFGMTWASSRIHEGNNKPIVLFGEFWNDLLDCFDRNMRMRPGERELLKVCVTPEEVLNYIKSVDKRA